MQPNASFTYGLPTPAEVAGKTGKEILQAIIDGTLPQAPVSEVLSFWLTEVGDGFAAFAGEPGRHLLNPMGGVHGGWALTLIDSVGGCAGHSLLARATRRSRPRAILPGRSPRTPAAFAPKRASSRRADR